MRGCEVHDTNDLQISVKHEISTTQLDLSFRKKTNRSSMYNVDMSMY